MNSFSKTGDWDLATMLLNKISRGSLIQRVQLKLNDLGEIAVEKLKEHIDNQDLNWAPLSPKTVEIKAGNDKIYVQTGMLRDSLKVVKADFGNSSYSLYIGVDDKATGDGTNLSDILYYMEYGTNKQPPRPLLAPTFMELKPLIQKEVRNAIIEILRGK